MVGAEMMARHRNNIELLHSILFAAAISFVTISVALLAVGDKRFKDETSLLHDGNGLRSFIQSAGIVGGHLFWRRCEVYEYLSHPSNDGILDLLAEQDTRRAGSIHLWHAVNVGPRCGVHAMVLGSGIIDESFSLNGDIGGGWTGYSKDKVISVSWSTLILIGAAAAVFPTIRFYKNRREHPRQGFAVGRLKS